MVLGASGCAVSAPPRPQPRSAPVQATSVDPFGPGRTEALRIDRYGVTIPLPDFPGWTSADDGVWATVTHDRSSTVVRVRRFEETSLVGRRECEVRAQLSGALPIGLLDKQRAETAGRGSFGTFEVMTDELLRRPRGWDGRRIVALESEPSGQLAGHVALLTGTRHSCLVVHAVSRTRGERNATLLAERLEVLSSVTLGGLTVDRAAAPEDPTLPTVPLPL